MSRFNAMGGGWQQVGNAHNTLSHAATRLRYRLSLCNASLRVRIYPRSTKTRNWESMSEVNPMSKVQYLAIPDKAPRLSTSSDKLFESCCLRRYCCLCNTHGHTIPQHPQSRTTGSHADCHHAMRDRGGANVKPCNRCWQEVIWTSHHPEMTRTLNYQTS